MKLATLKKGGRDGTLVVVNRALTHYRAVPAIARTLQAALDDWEVCEPQLRQVYEALNSGAFANADAFDPLQCHSPLPRAYQWADGSAYVNHVELVRRARGAELPPEFWTDPLMYQGGSDSFAAPNDPVYALSEDWGIDLEAEVAVITGDVKMGASAEQCAPAIRLLMLVNDVSLRNLLPAELAKGFGFVQSKPASAFSPVAITPDELGEAWARGRVNLPLQCSWNGRKVGLCDAGSDMGSHFGQLLAYLAKTRALRAGTILGAGPVSNAGIEKRGQWSWPKGFNCIAEKRAMETVQDGKAATEFMRYGDTVHIEMKDAAGQSLFGAIEQEMVS